MPTPNIIIIAVDTLRADHLGCYGYARPTSPNIDALARTSVRFERAFAAAIPTMPSFTAMLTGVHPYRSGVVSHIGTHPLASHYRTLPQLAQAAGYTTVGLDNLVTQGDGRGTHFARGYDHYVGFTYRPFSDQSRWLTDRAIELAGANAADPLLLFIHYWDPHTPYGPLPPYDTLHYTPGSGAYDLRDVIARSPEYYAGFLADMKLKIPDDYAYVVAQYDGEISQVDAQIGRLLDGLRATGVLDHSIVVLVGDHGEAFGEGDFHFDHHGLYDAVTRVPLLIDAPGIAPRAVASLASSDDLLPTIAELAGIPLPAYPLTGVSLVPTLADDTPARQFVVTTENTRQCSIAYRTTEWKLILPIVADAAGAPIPDFYGEPRDPQPLLFEMGAAAGESTNRAAERPAVLAALLDSLSDWRRATLAGAPDPLLTQPLTLSMATFMERVIRRARH